MEVASQYRRVLPSPPAVVFASTEVLQSGTLEGFFLNFETQSEPAFCGLASHSVEKPAAGEMVVVDPPATPEEDGAAPGCSHVSVVSMKVVEDLKARDGTAKAELRKLMLKWRKSWLARR